MASISLKDVIIRALSTCAPMTTDKLMPLVREITEQPSRVNNVLEELRKAQVVTYDPKGNAYTLNVPRATDRAPLPELTAKLVPAPVVISDLQLKVNVLNKLAPLMADGISEVLTAIKADLQQASQ